MTAKGFITKLSVGLSMARCNHVWIQLTSKRLEMYLLPGDPSPWNVYGCLLCGFVKNDEEEIFPPNYLAEGTGYNFPSTYWAALARFKDEKEL